MSQDTKKVMVFGVFDRLHEGHLHFLSRAASYGRLIVVVARDKAVVELKKRSSQQSEGERLQAIKELSIANEVVLGDEVKGSYEVIKKYKPSIICLGYDQDWLKEDLEEKIGQGLLPKTELIQINAHRPKELHSSLLNPK